MTNFNLLIVSFLTLIGRILGFIREIFLSRSYGIGSDMDAYLISLTYTMIFSGLIGDAIGKGYIPIVSRIDNEYERIKFTNNLINILSVFSLVLILILYLFLDDFINVIYPGIDLYVFNTAKKLTKLSMPMIFLAVFLGTFKSFLQYNGEYIYISFLNIISNLVFIVFFLFFPKSNAIEILSILNVLAYMLQIFYLKYASNKKGYKYIAFINISDKYIKEMSYIVIPVLIGVSVKDLNILVDKFFASTLDTGIISVFSYANKIIDLILGVLIMSFSLILFPEISKLYIDDQNKFKTKIEEAFNFIFLIMIPITFGLLGLSEEITTFIFSGGKFNDKAIILTSNALKYYALGVTSISINYIMNTIFYASGYSKMPMYLSILTLISNVILNTIFIEILGYKGLALASSISTIIVMVVSLIVLDKKIIKINIKKLFGKFILYLSSSIVMFMFIQYQKIDYELIEKLSKLNLFVYITKTTIMSIIIYFVPIIVIFKKGNSIKN